MELLGAAGVAIIGMIAVRQYAVHAMNRVRVGVGADLERLVLIDKVSQAHTGMNRCHGEDGL